MPPPENADYDLATNSFIIDSLLDGNIIELNYMPECGRSTDDTPDILDQTQETKQIPVDLKNNVASLDMDKHLCLTQKKKTIHKTVSLRICENTSEKTIISKTCGYCVNMTLLSNSNHILHHTNDKDEKNILVGKIILNTRL